MKAAVYQRRSDGTLQAWTRTRIRELPKPSAADTLSDDEREARNEKFLEDLIAEEPDLLGLTTEDGETDIEGPFKCFSQCSVRALNDRTIYPDLIILSESGHVIIVEVKLAGNPELRDRRVVAQVLEYAASLAAYEEADLRDLFADEATRGASWPELVASLFPQARDPERLAGWLLVKFRQSKIHLVIACDAAPVGLRELVDGIRGQAALGEFIFRVIEVSPYVSGGGGDEVIFLPYTKMQTEIVQRTAVSVTYQEGTSKPGLVVTASSLDEAAARTEQAQQRVSAREWDQETFLDDVRDRLGDDAREDFCRVFENVERRAYIIKWGKGAKLGSFGANAAELGEKACFSFSSDGLMWFNFKELPDNLAVAIRERLERIEGVSFSSKAYPTLKPRIWRERLDAILDVFDTARHEATAAPANIKF